MAEWEKETYSVFGTPCSQHKCSVCKTPALFTDISGWINQPKELLSNYCPNCGEQMLNSNPTGKSIYR
jgi:hypothetical protein